MTTIPIYLSRSMSTTKTCRGCSITLPIDSFYRHNRMADGRLNFCVECVKRRIAEHRDKNLERIRKYDRERSKLPHRQPMRRPRRTAQPENRPARVAVGNAIRDGRLIRPEECSDCGKQCKPEAHHDDYLKPLDVRWLCRSCHCRHHRLESLSLRYPLASAS